MRIDCHPDWRLRALCGKTYGILPYRRKINYFLKKNVIKSIPFSMIPHIKDKLPSILQIVSNNYVKKVDISMDQINFLEIGAGDHLINTLMVYLMGGRSNVVDIDHVVDFSIMKSAFSDYKNVLSQNNINGKNVNLYRLRKLNDIFDRNHLNKMDFVRLLGDIGINYVVAKRPEYSKFFDSESIDVVISEAVLEHVSKSDIRLMMINLKKILKPNGILLFYIDLRDHYARYKNSNEYNYLSFSDLMWNRFFNTPMLYQNRLTIDEYYKLFTDNGFRILSSKETTGDVCQLTQLKTMKINKRFLSIPIKRLMVRKVEVLMVND